MKYDVIVVGGGIAGLTATAYLAKEGYNVLLCEKQDEVGGLVSTFQYKGYVFDGGIRAIENSGIVMPMLRQLGIDVPFERSIVSLGIEDDVISVESEKDVEVYNELLKRKFPKNTKDIDKITKQISKIMKYMDVLYGIDNPLFIDIMKDKKYIFFTLLPWAIKYLFMIRKINKLNEPVESHLASLTDNQALNDVIAQHFFDHTPTFFALSYFSLYLDYQYPIEGTSMLVHAVEDFINTHNATIQIDTEIVSLDPEKKQITDAKNNTYEYDKLVWAGDLNYLYQATDLNKIKDPSLQKEANAFQEEISTLRGGDTVQTVYAMVDLDVDYFKDINTGHFFYTPIKKGLTPVLKKLDDAIKSNDKDTMFAWAKEYFDATTYEIAIPAIRNRDLAPAHKTGLIISTLMNFDFVNAIENLGWYKEYKAMSEDYMIDVLNHSIYPKLKDNVIETFSSTPLTIQHRTGNKDGAITGWAFTNPTMPAVHSMTKVSKSVYTKIPDVYQAGQWTYSPAGLPISIMTGKLASDAIVKANKNNKKI